MTRKENVLAMHIPEPRFICESVEFGAAATSEIHFGINEDGCRLPADLYYDELVEKETETESHGFFCQDCIEAFGRKTTNKTTLKQAIREQMEEAIREQMEKQLRKVAAETTQLMHCR